ncbi:MAG: hypothetical protein QN178_09965 [Armatimonadota bacterium]|nr:hypothetical protein [Armatimonadota bacterium]
MRTYRATATILAYHFALPVVFTSVLIAMLILLPRLILSDPLLAVFLIVWSLGVLWSWYQYLTTAFEIHSWDDGTYEFRAVARRTVLRAEKIRSLGAGRFDPYFVTLKHENGTLVLFPQIDGFHDFIARLKKFNPQIVVKGL